MTAQKFITEANKQKVCQLLDWTDLDYAIYQEEKGLEYLEHVICCDAWSVNNVAKCKMFWRWFINHWNIRDAQFIGEYGNYPRGLLKYKYEDLNDVESIKFYPHRVIMENTYQLMIDAVNKEAVAMEEVQR